MQTPGRATATCARLRGPRFTNFNTQSKFHAQAPGAVWVLAQALLARKIMENIDRRGRESGDAWRSASKFTLNGGAYADRMKDLLDILYALRPLWLPSLVLSLAACIGLALISM